MNKFKSISIMLILLFPLAFGTLGSYANELNNQRVIVSDSVDNIFKPSQVYRIYKRTRTAQFVGLDNSNDISLPNNTSASYGGNRLVVEVSGQEVTFRVLGE